MNRGINHDGTYRQAVDVDRIDAAILTEELAEIYSTPTPKGWLEPKKVNDLYLIDCVLLQQPGFDIYTRSLNINPTQARFVTSFGMEEIFLS